MSSFERLESSWLPWRLLAVHLKTILRICISSGAPQNHPSNPRFVEGEDLDYVEDEDDNPVATNRLRGGKTHGESSFEAMGIKLQINRIDFNGCVQPDDFLALITMVEEVTSEWLFTLNSIPNSIVEWSKPPIYDEESFVDERCERDPKIKEGPSSSSNNTNLM